MLTIMLWVVVYLLIGAIAGNVANRNYTYRDGSKQSETDARSHFTLYLLLWPLMAVLWILVLGIPAAIRGSEYWAAVTVDGVIRDFHHPVAQPSSTEDRSSIGDDACG